MLGKSNKQQQRKNSVSPRGLQSKETDKNKHDYVICQTVKMKEKNQ